MFFDAYNDKDMRKNCCSCIKYTETKIEKISDSFVKHGLEGILVLSTEYRWGDWNKCETHYSYDDKMFMCELWNKYYKGHEDSVIRTIYQMKTGELLPEILPVVAQIVDSFVDKGENPSGDCIVIIKTIMLRSLLDYAHIIKADVELHNSYEQILTSPIFKGDESAAVLLDEYRTH